ncbi:MAG: DEAD/DEAH box helicase family protein [Candidatus Velthaea sp.]
MPGLHTEVNFEDELVGHLTKHGGWLAGEPAGYDNTLGLYPEDVIGWIKDTQPIAYAKVKATHNGGADAAILTRLAKVLSEVGTLAVLRNGFASGNAKIDMCAFRPGHGLNPKTLEAYGMVRCRVVRQVQYSIHNGNSIDVVLFINGIPVATLELKTDMTQTVQNAVKQYKEDRLPRDPQTGKEEPLLAFKRGALVHFAVSTDEVQMTTRLNGVNTVFLPFNLGNDGAAGNPPNPQGFKTAYLWERVLQRDALLEIVEKYLHIEKVKQTVDGKKVTTEQLIFPRYHQWDAVRSLISTAKAEGPGHNYLVQHSAGSGKSNTIMWLAYQLSSLHNIGNNKIFDSIIVVTDRQVLDDQLQKTISQFEHKDGVVKRITKEASKSSQLRDALEKRTPIIIVTIQTFPYALDTISELKDVANRSFAIIADEAHSSQTGEAAKKLRQALGIADEQDDDDEEVSAEDALVAQMAKRAKAKNISYFAFTATPKWKTLQLFGRTGPSGKPEPFHIYSMQQAIEEGFILDVLQNYTTYDAAYKLAVIDEKTGETIVPKSEAAKRIKAYLKLHPHMIDQKVAIIIEHFRESVAPLLNGRAKAMVVCDSRKAAVRYKRAFDKYITDRKYDIAALVAFSGEVKDEINGVTTSDTEASMNHLKGESIPEAFGRDAYRVLLVAEKFQTGFDQPLLVAMYVDKTLSGIKAVQTLSRLNRIYERDGVKKDETFILDFVNTADNILKAFLPYYKTATLASEIDPDLIHDLQTKLDGVGIYANGDVESYFAAYYQAQKAKKGEKRQSLLKAVLDPIVARYNTRVAEAKKENDSEELQLLESFKRNLQSFIRGYSFLSQIFNYENTGLEKRHIFFSGLSRLLKNSDEKIVDTSGVQLTHRKIEQTFTGAIDLKGKEDTPIDPRLGGSTTPHSKEYGPLADVVKALNDILGIGIEDEHQIVFVLAAAEKMVADQTLQELAQNNSAEQFKNAANVIARGQEMLVETKEDLKAKNDRQNEAFDQALSRLFADKEGLARVVDALSEYVYRQHQKPQAP